MEQVIDETSMHIPKKKSVILLILLSVITLGIYPFVWFIKRSAELNNLQTTTKSKKNMTIISLVVYLLIYLLIAGLYVTAYLTDETIAAVTDISQIPTTFLILYGVIIAFIIILIILLLILAFNTRKILNEAMANKNVNKKASGFFTLIFNLFYLQYEINGIINDEENDKRLGPLITLLVIFLLALASAVTAYFMYYK